jgi:signal peptide peptidase SppA
VPNTFLLRIADRVLNRPLLILPEKLALITEVLAGRIGVEGIGLPESSRFVGDANDIDAAGRAAGKLPYRRTAEGVGVVTITGSLVNRGAWIGSQSGMTSYEGIAHQLESAVRDKKVKSVILDIDSPGGEAVGAIETAALVRKAQEEKPVYAIVNGMAASAAYAIASGAKAIFSTPSGVSGSIGVVLMHADYSRAVDRAGITPTLIHAGAHKVDGNPYTPLSSGVKEDLQAEVDRYYGLFIGAVAEGRGRRLSAKSARATEARTFIGQSARDAGLIDGVGDFAGLLDQLSRSSAGGVKKRTKNMSLNMHDDSDLAAARAEGHRLGLDEGRKAGFDEGFATGKAEGAKEGYEAGAVEGRRMGAEDERARIKAILTHPEAKSREASATHLALNTSMSVEDAAGALSGLAKTSSIATRASETITPLNGGEHVPAGNMQPGAESWASIADRLNAETLRRPGASR